MGDIVMVNTKDTLRLGIRLTKDARKLAPS